MAYQHTVCHCSKWINTSQPIKSFALVCHRNMCTPKNLLKVSQTGYNDEWVSCCWNFRFYADVLSLNFNLKFYSSHYTHLNNIFFRFSFPVSGLDLFLSTGRDNFGCVCLFVFCMLACVRVKELMFPHICTCHSHSHSHSTADVPRDISKIIFCCFYPSKTSKFTNILFGDGSVWGRRGLRTESMRLTWQG